MDSYISRDEAANLLHIYAVSVDKTNTLSGVLRNIVRDIPAADVRPVVRGEWVYGSFDVAWCSVCGEIFNDFDCRVDQYNFCPNCGADMSEADHEP